MPDQITSYQPPPYHRRTNLLDLPNELLSNIAAFLSTEGLLDASLACRALAVVCKAYIFRHLDVDTSSMSSSPKLLLRSFVQHPELAEHCRSVIFTFGQTFTKDGGEAIAKSLLEPLAGAENLMKVDAYFLQDCQELGSASRNLYRWLAHLKQIQILRIYRTHAPMPFTLMNVDQFSALRRLDLMCNSLIVPDIGNEDLFQRAWLQRGSNFSSGRSETELL